MKLHFNTAAAEELRERRGGCYVLCSVCLEGFPLGKARYRQLRRWDAQLRQLFGSAVPGFPPKCYLVMTESMADERQSQLEQYLQNVMLNSNITSSDNFIVFFQKLQLDTFKIPTQRAFLDVYLGDGSNVRLDIQTSDTTERILECKMGLSGELIKYFSLFFFQDHDDRALSGKFKSAEKVADFELPYVSLQIMKDCKLRSRKWHMDPSLDTLLMGCGASLNLLYMQAVQEVKRDWVKPTEGQMQELKFLQKNENKAKFLDLIREVQLYGYVWLDLCTCDCAEEGCLADICVGNNEINCCIKLPTNQTKEVSFKINRSRSWQVIFLGATKHGEEDILEFRFEYNDSGTGQWVTLYIKQAFVLNNCLKKIISEQMMKAAKEGQEMEFQMSKSMKNSKKSTIQQKQVIHSGFTSRKKKLVRPSEEDCVFEKIREEDL
ncbi:LOW QUALITY PROTEIN: sorting nexin-31 [Phaethornis superciliosus]